MVRPGKAAVNTRALQTLRAVQKCQAVATASGVRVALAPLFCANRPNCLKIEMRPTNAVHQHWQKKNAVKKVSLADSSFDAN